MGRQAPAAGLWRVTFADGTPDVVVRDVIKREYRRQVQDHRLLTAAMSRFLLTGYAGREMDADGLVWRSRDDIARQVDIQPRNVQANTAKARHSGFLRCVQLGRKVGRQPGAGQSSIYQACLPVRGADVDDMSVLPVWPCPAVVLPKRRPQGLQGDVQGDAAATVEAVSREMNGVSLDISLDVSPVVRPTTGATPAALKRSSTPRFSAASPAAKRGRGGGPGAAPPQRNRSDDAKRLDGLAPAISDLYRRRARVEHERDGLPLDAETVNRTAAAIARREYRA